PPLLGAPGRVTRVVLGVGCLALLVTPALMAVSQGQLNRSVNALKRGDCAQAIDAGLESAKAMRSRPEPLQVIGYCDSRLGEHDLAERVFRRATRVEPGNWQSWYGLALVRGAAGADPRPAAARALELNPREPLARDAVRRFRTGDPRQWKRRALSARLPIL
ncbi:MAG TPA: hypothetical protein VEQ61_06690, partial [Thermoleophilaceae bacterium]|nr:hypothetical protein [Thermoleophilaceae bacterium]